jgi:DNA topoisomerase VI subunit B
MRKLKREVFATSRLLEFSSERELINQTGHAVEDWLLVILKELIDNAIDVAEEVGVAPTISITVANGRIVVTDNGPGIAREVVKNILNYNVRVSSREAYVSPTRGAQGNALKTIIAMPFALNSTVAETVIESKGVSHHIAFKADYVRQEPKIQYHGGGSNVKNGTRITTPMPLSACSKADEAKPRFLQLARGFAWLNPHLALDIAWDGDRIAWAPTNAGWEKWRPSDPTSAHWHDANRLTRLMAAYIVRDRDAGREPRTVREFVSEFRGLTGTAKQKRVLDEIGAARVSLLTFFGRGDVDQANVAKLLAAMQKGTRPVEPRDLGLIGEDHLRQRFVEAGADEETFKYKREFVVDGGVPQVVEVAFGYCPEGDERQIVAGVNWSPGISNPFRKLGPYGESLDTYLSQQRAGDSDEPITLVIHLASPRVDYTDRGKTAVALSGAGGNGLEDEKDDAE